MEIERKYLVTDPPRECFSHPFRTIEQAYLCTDSEYYLTYKGRGLLAREEYNLPLHEAAYRHLLPKADGIILTKKRYRIPLDGTSLVIELDVFSGAYEGLMLAEVEFPDEEAALAFTPPVWFGRDVTFTGEYQNSRLALKQM